jgi:serine phosphatase RsbU (regulator of sigma subunit)/Tfp pilus assembly protein PilF
MKLNPLVALVVFIFSFFEGGAYNEDSLKLAAKTARYDTLKVRLLQLIIESERDIKAWIPYNNEMFEVSKKNLATNPAVASKNIFLTHEGKYYVNCAYIQFNDGNLDSTAALYKIALSLMEQAQNMKDAANTLHNLASVVQMQGKNDEAMELLQRALNILKEKVNDLNELSIVYNKIAQVYYFQGSVTKALEYYHSGLRLAEQGGNKTLQGAFLNNIATIYKEQKEFDKALEYHFKGLKIAREAKDKIGISTITNNIGNAYLLKKDLKQALKYFREGLQLREEFGDKPGVAGSMINIGTTYLEMDSLEKGRAYYFKALEILEVTKGKRNLANVNCYIGNTYVRAKDFSKGLPYILRGMTIGKEIGSPEIIRDASRDLCLIYDHNGDYKKAFEMHKLFVIMRDSIFSSQTKKAALKSQLRYDFERKAAADSVKVAEEKMITDLKLKHEENTRYALYAGLLLVLLFAGFMVNRFKVTQKQKNIIARQKHIVEEKQKEIIDSINYAKRIQSALLAHRDFLNDHIPDNFVLFKPKDIVSGDFYWATEHQNKFYLAVCDSTGHGVPGAFMSLLNIGFLSEAINEKNILEPHEVFNYVRKRLIDGISKEGQKDGFDGILLCIDKKTNAITYTAANNAPIVIRDGNILELAKDKMPVGKGERTESFTTHNIDLHKGDSLYLYTDGYADQFGGPKGKKFLYKRLNELLRTISIEHIHGHGDKLETKFEDWKGPLEQVDDVCIVGIKL